MEQALDLKVLFYMIRKKFIWIVVAAFVGAIAAFFISEYAITDTFTSSTQVYISNSQEAQYSDKVNNTDLSASKSMASTYCIILQSRRATALLEAKLQQNEIFANTQPKFQKYSLGVSVRSSSEVLSITAKAYDPVIASIVCNTMVDVSAELISEIFESGRSNSLGEAPINYNPASPNVRQNMLIGIIVGFAVSVALVVLTFLVDNRVKDESDFVRKVGIPVLGEVPSMNTTTTGKEKYAYYANYQKENS
nr:hypothetical protein [Clostridia bacterium]